MEEASLEDVHYSVLLIDDDAVSSVLLAKHLERGGYTATVVHDGKSALTAMEAMAFDIVLLDVDMPGMNGHQVLAQIKSNPKLKDIPVMMLTGAMNTESVLKCRQLGASEYLLKPYNLAIVKSRMLGLLRK